MVIRFLFNTLGDSFIPKCILPVDNDNMQCHCKRYYYEISRMVKINVQQCLQAVLLSFSIIFQYFACIFSIFQYFTKSSIYYVCTKFPRFSVFLKFYQYLWSEFSKNTDKSVYLEALCTVVLLYIAACMCTFVNVCMHV